MTRTLIKKNIKVSFSPYIQISNMLKSVKDYIPLQSSGIYMTPCKCGKVYIGQTGRTVSTRLKEHQRNSRLNYPEKSAIAQHAIEFLHGIDFEETKIIARAKFMDARLIREAIEIKKHPNNFNHCEGLDLNKAWLPLIKEL